MISIQQIHPFHPCTFVAFACPIKDSFDTHGKNEIHNDYDYNARINATRKLSKLINGQQHPKFKELFSSTGDKFTIYDFLL